MAFMGDLVVRYGATTKGFDAGTRRVRGGLTSITKGVTRMITSMAPLAGGALFASMSRNAELFTRKMNQSLAIMGDVSEETQQKMSKAAFRIASDTVFSAEQAAESYFFLASAGLSTAQSLAAIPVVAKFAQAGMFDMAKATDLLTDAQSALGLTVDDTTQNMKNMILVSDVLVKANTLANASVEQFSQSLTTKAAAALRIVNKDIEEGVAVLAAFADQGLKGSDAGTALNIVMRDLQTKALLNKDAFEAAGIAVFDSAGEMNNLADIIGDLEDRLSGMSDATKKQTLLNLGFADKSVIFIQTLIGMSDKIREYERELRNAGGTTEDVAGKQMTPMQEAMADLESKATQLGKAFNEAVVPSMVAVASIASSLLLTLTLLAPAILATTLGLVAYTAILKAAGVAMIILKALSGPQGWKTIAIGIAVATVSIAAMTKQMADAGEEAKIAQSKIESFATAAARANEESGRETRKLRISTPGRVTLNPALGGIRRAISEEERLLQLVGEEVDISGIQSMPGILGELATEVSFATGRLKELDAAMQGAADESIGIVNQFDDFREFSGVQNRMIALWDIMSGSIEEVKEVQGELRGPAIDFLRIIRSISDEFGSWEAGVKAAQSSIDSLRSPLDKLNEDQLQFARLFLASLITEEEHMLLRAKAAEEFDAAIGGPEQKISELNDEIRILTGVATAGSIALEKLSQAGATPGQIEDIRNRQLFIKNLMREQEREAAGRALERQVQTPFEKAVEKAKEDIRKIEALFDSGQGVITPETRRRALEQLKADLPGADAPGGTRFGGALQQGTTAAFSGILASISRTSGDKQRQIAKNTELTAEELAALKVLFQQQLDNEPVPVNIDGAP